MADGRTEAWRYEAKRHDPQASRNAFNALLEDGDEPLTELDLMDDYDSPPAKLIIHRPDAADKETIECPEEEIIAVDFKKFDVKLPKAMTDALGFDDAAIPHNQVRYCGFPSLGLDGSPNDGRTTILSVWTKDKSIRNLYLALEDAEKAMLLINAFTRLIYDSSGKSKIRTHRFHPILDGPVDVACCSVIERNERDAVKMKRDARAKAASKDDDSKLEADTIGEGGMKEEDDDEDDGEELPELKKTPMYFVVDEEALCLFENPFSPAPLHDFRFYREVTSKSIDHIFVSHTADNLEVQQGDNVFYIYAQEGDKKERSTLCFNELIDTLRRGTVKPKPSNIFGGTGKDFESFFSVAYIGKPYKLPKTEPSATPMTTAPAPMTTTPAGEKDRESFSPPMQAVSSGVNEIPWLNNIITGNHLAAVSEDLQVMWFSIQEPELDKAAAEGLVPQFNIDSAGLNAQSHEHLQKLIEEVKDKLLSEKFGEALSVLRGCVQVYGQTLLSPVAGIRELDLMKRIYFLSG